MCPQYCFCDAKNFLATALRKMEGASNIILVTPATESLSPENLFFRNADNFSSSVG